MKTITNQETIKPSSPTPPHLNRYNLSFIDNKIPNFHLPWVFLYKNYNKDDINKLKKSLSKCLTQYYPFAGRLPSPSASYVECNDEGVEFLEASIDVVRLEDLVLKRDPDETIINNELVPNLGIESSNRMLEVQVNHFSCGGVAVAVSISHKIADGFTMANLVNHWATVTRGGSPIINPTFVSAPVRDATTTTTNVHQDDHQSVMKKVPSKDKYTAKRFVFSNSKLNDLKNRINNMNITPLNPSRVESLTSLLFKCAVNAATTKAGGSFQPSNLSLMVNMREKISSTTVSLKNAVGNILNLAIAKMADNSSEIIHLHEVITRLRKDRMEIEGAAVRDVEELGEMYFKRRTGFLQHDQSHRVYGCTSLCNFSFYGVDFGWGNPVRVILPFHNWDDSSYFTLMDAASGDGIEATVILEEGEMAHFQNDKDLAYVQD
uniref:acyltransferase Pun1-like n=1 Tax=Erigeron canadensis TaxID=72917 RepID=UPI001CB8E4BA|nr:acyltransferase Pun1-like [Erigeron canadensis]